MIGGLSARLRVPTLPFGRAPGSATTGDALPPVRRRPTMRAEAPAPVPAPEQAAASAKVAGRPMARPTAKEAGEADLLADAPFKLPPCVSSPSPARAPRSRSTGRRSPRPRGCSRRCSTISTSRARSSRCAPGPVVTMYELEPAPRHQGQPGDQLADDIARNMSRAVGARRDDPGRSVIGIELPNAEARDGVASRSWSPAQAFEDTGRHAADDPRQEHRRRSGGRRPRADAASAGRRHHRLGQVGRRSTA